MRHSPFTVVYDACGLALLDANDRHVLVAAIRSGASVIVTFNQTDFPIDALAPFGIEAQQPALHDP